MSDDIVAALKRRDAKWEPVAKARPTIIKPHPVRKEPKGSGDWKTAIAWADSQIGWRFYTDGTMQPTHSPVAMDVALQILAYEQRKNGVDLVLNLGDMIDLPAQSRWTQEAAFATSTQAGIDTLHMFLAQVRATAPDAQVVYLDGNHDLRLGKQIQLNAAASFGIRRADMPTSWPVMSMPFLLRLDELQVDYIESWPNERFPVTKSLIARHGDRVRSGGSTASAYANAHPHMSSLHGHIHRIELQSRTVPGPDGPIHSVAFSPGCLCRTDGAVPSYASSVDVNGKPVARVEDWQNGLSVIHYNEARDRFTIVPIPIVDGEAFYDGRVFAAEQTSWDALDPQPIGKR